MRRISRREFAVLAGSLAGSGLPFWEARGEFPARSMQLRTEFLIALGRGYLAQSPKAMDAVQLRERLEFSSGGDFDAAALRSRVSEDFAEARIVIVDGWHLSLTEARVYALLSLQ